MSGHASYAVARGVSVFAAPGRRDPRLRRGPVAVKLKGHYSSREVAAETGLTARQLQWWDERGIFAPSLSIGAGLGHALTYLLGNPEHAGMLLVLAMAGFLAAATQAPITSFIIVMEMVDGYSKVIALMAVALFASWISRLFCPPLYMTLARRYAPPPTPPAPPPEALPAPPPPRPEAPRTPADPPRT